MIIPKVETVSPAVAQDWLRVNPVNRSINVATVRRYADLMSRGEWDLNGESIKLASDGTLIDGQHRLSAVVKANVSVLMIVVRGLDPSAQNTVDIGMRRTVGSALGMRGVKNCNNVAAIIAKVRTYEGAGTLAHMGGTYYPTPAEALAEYEAEASLFDEAAAMAMRWNSSFRVETGVSGALFVLTGRANLGQTYEFFEAIVHGSNLDSRDPRLVLRNLLSSDALKHKRMSPVSRAAVVVLGWDYWFEGRSIARIRWNNSERFPRIVL